MAIYEPHVQLNFNLLYFSSFGSLRGRWKTFVREIYNIGGVWGGPALLTN